MDWGQDRIAGGAATATATAPEPLGLVFDGSFADPHQDAHTVYRPPGSRPQRLAAILALVTGAVLVAVIALKATAVPAPRTIRQVDLTRAVQRPHRAHRRHAAVVVAYPGVPAMERVSSYLESRAGHEAFAVVDTRGREYGLNMHETFVSASVAKAMLLVAYLRVLAHEHRGLDAVAQSLLYPMIHQSDNHAASAVWRLVGDEGLRDVAASAHMTEFGFGSDWANEQISAADQAKLFYRMDSLIPHPFRHWARALLSGVDPAQGWGIPAVGRPRWTVFFKGGWRLTGTGQLVSQIARLEQGHKRVAIAVMTSADPSMAYGIQTIETVTQDLLAG
jgi:hypothetical protein